MHHGGLPDRKARRFLNFGILWKPRPGSGGAPQQKKAAMAASKNFSF
jgi:hypothetical protein